MKKAAVTIVDLVLWLGLQLPLLAAVTVLELIALARRPLRRGYMVVTRLRRRLRGEPVWQPHDELMGAEGGAPRSVD